MSAPDGHDAEDLLTAMAERLQREQRLQAEVQRARREFSGSQPTAVPSVPGAADAAARRFAEWFLLERESEVLGTVPAEVDPFAALALDLPESLVGVFLVQPGGGRSIVALDLQDDGLLEVQAPPGSLQPGDLLVGRLWAEGAGRWRPSSVLAVFRPGAGLAQAFRRDVRRLDLDRRLQQVELEHLLLQGTARRAAPADAPPAVPLERLEADLDRLLLEAGSDVQATDVSQQLALAVRPGGVVGPLLDQLAFETVVDLDRARALLIEIWNAHHRDDDAPAIADASPGAPSETLGERLVRTLDEGLSQKRDVDDLFAQLERMAGIEPEPEEPADDEPDDEDGDELAGTQARGAHGAELGGFDENDGYDDDEDEVSAGVGRARRGDAAEPDDEITDGAGDLAPLVEEYLWETDRAQDPRAAPLRMLAELQQNSPLPHADLEQVTPTDVMRLLLHVYLGSAPEQRAAAVRSAVDELRTFFAWAVTEQELAVGGVLAACQGALLDQLDRLQAAGVGLSTAAKGSPRRCILEVDDLGPNGFGARDDDGASHWLAAPPAVVQHLRVGDLVLGALGPAAGGSRALAGLVVVLPSDAKALME